LFNKKISNLTFWLLFYHNVFQNSITLGPPFNLGLILCTHYTLPNAIECMGKPKVLW
jgi:hypothetical protein